MGDNWIVIAQYIFFIPETYETNLSLKQENFNGNYASPIYNMK